MITLITRFTLVTIKLYQEKCNQIIEFVRANPNRASEFFSVIEVDIRNINMVLESLEPQIEIFEPKDVRDLVVFKNSLVSSVKAMSDFVKEITHIEGSLTKDNFDNVNYAKFKFNDTDGDAA